MIWIPKPKIMLRYREACKQRVRIALKVRERVVEVTEVSDLACMCGIASTALARAFIDACFPARLVFGDFNFQDHCWVVSDDIVYDISATQFGNYRKAHVEYAYDSEAYDADSVINPSDWSEVEQFFKYWPECQRPQFSDIDFMVKGHRLKAA